jgi:pimeloyl-ACP methyl ester carboxylesterase
VSRHRLYAIFAVDVRAQLKNCNVPVLHLYARQDHLVLRSSTREIQQVRPDIPSIGIDGPHYLYQMRPQTCAAAIERFLLDNSLGP